jgi:hypothetical protein
MASGLDFFLKSLGVVYEAVYLCINLCFMCFFFGCISSVFSVCVSGGGGDLCVFVCVSCQNISVLFYIIFYYDDLDVRQFVLMRGCGTGLEGK